MTKYEIFWELVDPRDNMVKILRHKEILFTCNCNDLKKIGEMLLEFYNTNVRTEEDDDYDDWSEDGRAHIGGAL